MTQRRRLLASVSNGLVLACLSLSMAASYGSAAPPAEDEPRKPTLSLARAGEYLDTSTTTWIHKRKCASCHTGFPYMLARPLLGDAKAPALLEVRKFFEDRITAWDEGSKGAGMLKGDFGAKNSEGITEIVGIAATLALYDAQTTGRLHPRTRRALDRMWELQRADGSWAWNVTGLAPLESDIYFGVVYAALGAGHAPDDYARSDSARAGLARLRDYLRKNPPPNLHHKLWLLWASLKLDGLMTPAQRDETIKELLALQHDDGGWCLPSLGDWKRRNGKPNDPHAASDGYSTGLIVYVLRQAGLPATREPICRGVSWLTNNQQPSGRWFTRSLNTDQKHYISDAGTAFAVMALKACEVKDP